MQVATSVWLYPANFRAVQTQYSRSSSSVNKYEARVTENQTTRVLETCMYFHFERLKTCQYSISYHCHSNVVTYSPSELRVFPRQVAVITTSVTVDWQGQYHLLMKSCPEFKLGNWKVTIAYSCYKPLHCKQTMFSCWFCSLLFVAREIMISKSFKIFPQRRVYLKILLVQGQTAVSLQKSASKSLFWRNAHFHRFGLSTTNHNKFKQKHEKHTKKHIVENLFQVPSTACIACQDTNSSKFTALSLLKVWPSAKATWSKNCGPGAARWPAYLEWPQVMDPVNSHGFNNSQFTLSSSFWFLNSLNAKFFTRFFVDVCCSHSENLSCLDQFCISPGPPPLLQIKPNGQPPPPDEVNTNTGFGSSDVNEEPQLN